MAEPEKLTDLSDLEPLWTPPEGQETLLECFITYLTDKTGQDFPDFDALHAWSVENSEEFWSALWDFGGVIGDKGQTVIEAIDHVPWARFFPDSKISYAENILACTKEMPDEPAIIARHQDGSDRVLTWQDLYDQVSRWEQALKNAGVGEGDRVAVYLPNIPETISVMLAASNLGAVFSSAGMEMGPDDMIRRFSQVEPKILITADGYEFAQKKIGRLDVIARAQAEIPSIEKTVVLPLLDKSGPDMGGVDNTVSGEDFLAPFESHKIDFIRRDFNHPLYILFSSGSTGQPKCFVHGAGGTLLKHISEYQLHCDVKPGDRVFYHATPSWMMWNWLASGLANGATIMMYDGSPSYPDAYAQWDFTASNGCTHHGTAAPVILGWEQDSISPGERYDLSPLRMILSTGAVLPPQGFEFIHRSVKRDVKISSISGGTDIVACFVGGNPMAPTYAGQINGPMLGLDVRVWNDDGNDLEPGKAGELVCVNPFPSMPLYFLDDPDGKRYADEYYARQRAWHQGDSIERTLQGQFVIHGRSDATLNQNGVRIGPVVIYNQLEPFSDRINAAAIDFIRPDNSQSITVLFLTFDDWEKGVPDDLVAAICKAVKDNVGPYSVPTEIVAVPGVLHTPNGKIAEVVMKKVLAGKEIPNPSLYGEDLVAHYEEIGRQLTRKYSSVPEMEPEGNGNGPL